MHPNKSVDPGRFQASLRLCLRRRHPLFPWIIQHPLPTPGCDLRNVAHVSVFRENLRLPIDYCRHGAHQTTQYFLSTSLSQSASCLAGDWLINVLAGGSWRPPVQGNWSFVFLTYWRYRDVDEIGDGWLSCLRVSETRDPQIVFYCLHSISGNFLTWQENKEIGIRKKNHAFEESFAE